MIRSLSTAILVLACAFGAQADELIYRPVNPAFGGSPLNGEWLLDQAEAQNKHEDDSSDSRTADLGSSATDSDLERFNDLLQRAILSRLSSAATSAIIGDSNTLQPGTITAGDFEIDIVSIPGDFLLITTTDLATGASTSFQVSNNPD